MMQLADAGRRRLLDQRRCMDKMTGRLDMAMGFADKLFEVLLLTLLAVLLVTGLIFAPGELLWLLAKAALVIAGLVLLVVLWGWRKPKQRFRIMRLTKQARAVAGQQVPVLRTSWIGSPASLRGFYVRFVVATDSEGDVLLRDRFRKEFARLVEQHGLSVKAGRGVRFGVDSQQTVHRDFGGNWFDYDR